MRFLAVAFAVSATFLFGCNSSSSEAPSETSNQAELKLTQSTETSFADIGDAVVWRHSSTSDNDILITTLEADGVALYQSDGKQLAHLNVGEVTGADIRYDITFGDAGAIDVLALALPDEQALAFYHIKGDSAPWMREVGRLSLPEAAEGVCLYKNPTNAELIVTATTEQGRALQYKLKHQAGVLTSTLFDDESMPIAVRQIDVGGELSACVADDSTATLYIAEQDLGIWAYGAEPEHTFERRLVDTLAPLGQLQEVEGLDFIYQSGGYGYLVAADEGKGITLYSAKDAELLTQFDVPGFDEVKALAVAHDGLWLANSELEQPIYQKMSFTSLAAQNEMANAQFSMALNPADVAHTRVALVAVSGETTPVDDDGDAADDPALWVNPEDPAHSVIVATNKQGGLMAYNLAGEELQYLNQGEPNNVDIRTLEGPEGANVNLVAASNRDGNTIAFYTVSDPSKQNLPLIVIPAVGDNTSNGEIQTSLNEVYGLCMYQAVNGDAYVFINGKSGLIEQWRVELVEQGVSGTLVRTLSVPSQPEGCVADDATGELYLGEEDVGIWRFGADESADTAGELITKIDGDILTADVEGLALYHDGQNKYLLASSQGSHSYVAYDLNKDLQVVSQFALVANDEAGLDGASETDGIHVTAQSLGDSYPDGLLIVQDGYNVDSQYQQQNQNFKLVNWNDIAASF
ncbi:phytase [Vibrio sp. SM6]|uniref:Phytase n=1 Tax=Vibrio agarilyticus TaxID=2726741 RepID=A0A7X8TQ32_9VIBR|nr:phytase [Vibrio agarilyticus]NLS12675.1 phytase [Vibrio agarilyticus]